MKIGVISDTHVPVNAPEIPSEVISGLIGCDLVIHAGDIVELEVLDQLKVISKVVAVCGNMDSPPTKDALPSKRTLEVAGKKICLMHGYGRPNGIIDILKQEFFKEKPDIIIFGHSHIPVNQEIDGVLFFNPGSATDKAFTTDRSYGIIEIIDGKITAAINKLKG